MDREGVDVAPVRLTWQRLREIRASLEVDAITELNSDISPEVPCTVRRTKSITRS